MYVKTRNEWILLYLDCTPRTDIFSEQGAHERALILPYATLIVVEAQANQPAPGTHTNLHKRAWHTGLAKPAAKRCS